jgi:hypothetical protein
MVLNFASFRGWILSALCLLADNCYQAWNLGRVLMENIEILVKYGDFTDIAVVICGNR